MRRSAKVYVMRDGDGYHKVGHSRDPNLRRRGISRSVELVYSTGVLDEAERVEYIAHKILKREGRHIEGEWFSASLDEAIAAINEAIRVVAEYVPPVTAPEKQPKASQSRDYVPVERFTDDDLRRALAKAIEAAGSLNQYAARIGLSAAYISGVMRGGSVSARLASVLGYVEDGYKWQR